MDFQAIHHILQNLKQDEMREILNLMPAPTTDVVSTGTGNSSYIGRIICLTTKGIKQLIHFLQTKQKMKLRRVIAYSNLVNSKLASFVEHTLFTRI